MTYLHAPLLYVSPWNSTQLSVVPPDISALTVILGLFGKVIRMLFPDMVYLPTDFSTWFDQTVTFPSLLNSNLSWRKQTFCVLRNTMPLSCAWIIFTVTKQTTATNIKKTFFMSIFSLKSASFRRHNFPALTASRVSCHNYSIVWCIFLYRPMRGYVSHAFWAWTITLSVYFHDNAPVFYFLKRVMRAHVSPSDRLRRSCPFFLEGYLFLPPLFASSLAPLPHILFRLCKLQFCFSEFFTVMIPCFRG